MQPTAIALATEARGFWYIRSVVGQYHACVPASRTAVCMMMIFVNMYPACSLEDQALQLVVTDLELDKRQPR